ncbi:MAG TPA: ATP-binding protein [Longimicrobium sp.]|uniref:sensor histidine kinase n=1 Tax=Longimicrobium sp. TaxID=2029185 RepID=UPI002ED9ED17
MQVHPEHLQAAPSYLPHGYCYLWNPPLLWTHVVSDLLIGGAYIVISVALAYLVHRARRDIPFSLVFVAFGLFIIACGFTHLIEVWTLWNPAYWFAGGVKVVTAAASVATAAAMPVTVPRVLVTLRDARLSRERELAEARAVALQEQNETLQAQAVELSLQSETSQQLAAELEDANERLQWALEEAREALRRAEAADRAKGDFLATMSHELRTPLNAIIGYEELLEEGLFGPVTEAQQAQLRRIRDSAGHLRGLVDEVLTLSRAESGRETAAVEAVQVAAVVRAAAEMTERDAAAKGLRFSVAAPPPELVMQSDAGKLRQILLNLLGNAVKFTERGEVRLAVRQEGAEVVFEVHDTGIGMSAEALPHIFDAFWQVEQSRTRSYGGSGLGLAVSKRLAGLLGGTLTAASTPGEGSTFTLRLPKDGPAAAPNE